MAESNIKQEILDWYNAENESDEKAEYFDEAWTDFYDSIWGSERRPQNGLDLPSGRAVILEDFGGEGMGDTRYVVFAVGEKIYRVDGYYASWDGTTWEDPTPYEVVAKEVTVIQYEKA